MARKRVANHYQPAMLVDRVLELGVTPVLRHTRVLFDAGMIVRMTRVALWCCDVTFDVYPDRDRHLKPAFALTPPK